MGRLMFNNILLLLLLLFLVVLTICLNSVECSLINNNNITYYNDNDDTILQNNYESNYRYSSFTSVVNNITNINNFNNNNNKNLNKNYHHSQQQDQDYHPHHQQLQQQQQHQLRRGQRQKHNQHGTLLIGTLTEHLMDDGVLWPPVFNVATNAKITANATCGENGREEYCKLNELKHNIRSRASQCGICDVNSPDLEKRHPIEHVLDATNKWWQSPTLNQGKEYETVTITLDLRQVYQIVYLTIKSAISPRPAAWILERSLDDQNYSVWQYFAVSDSDCRSRYGLTGQQGKYTFTHDSEILCSTQFAKPIPNGEIHLALLNGRPGANVSSPELLNFTMARFIRLRLQAIHTSANTDNNVKWMTDTQAADKRSFYSLRFIRIGGRCLCSGHADKCYSSNTDDDPETNIPECECLHNTCGKNCETCCPLYNQQPYKQGIPYAVQYCEKCECYGHAKECIYDAEVAENKSSINSNGEMIGGGVCINCTKFTTGINCEKCLPNYYHPENVSLYALEPCLPCDCDPVGSHGICDINGGACVCKVGFTGHKCSQCSLGYSGENCTKCSCDIRGTMPGGDCEAHCQCKLHVEGKYCDKCLPGYFALRQENPEGCLKCYCSGIGMLCESSNISLTKFENVEGWSITDITKSVIATPTRDNNTGNLVFGMYEFPDVESVYWMAPPSFCGNKLSSYGSLLINQLSWVIVRGDTSGRPTLGPSIILMGKNGMKIAYGDQTYKNSNATISVVMMEDGWYHVPRSVKDIITRLKRTEYRGDPVTRVQFMSVLNDIESILIRATFHTDQIESILEHVTLHIGGISNEISIESSLVEKCECPPGYVGLSCESCDFGYIPLFENTTSHVKIRKCIPCACNGHAASCNLDAGTCGDCMHNTFGDRCERCIVGYYGNAMYGTVDDCKRCACPLTDSSNNFSPSCQLKELSLNINHFDKTFNWYSGNASSMEYICTQCPEGYTGDHCEICDDGFFGSPKEIGSKCLPCNCAGGPCDPVTGNCISCLGNTEGWRCERCKSGYWGDPALGCEACNCFEQGSLSAICNVITGDCECKPRYSGILCDKCDFGYANASTDCSPCNCNSTGALGHLCDPLTGQCDCHKGINGLKCDGCIDEYYNFSNNGCEECNCNPYGSDGRLCSVHYGQCRCKQNVTGRNCNQCLAGYWNLESGNGCKPCNCDLDGSMDNVCDVYTGVCRCKPGIGGATCNDCIEGFYGFSKQGCKKCEECSNPAYICDPDTGRCVCPISSRGPDCKQCFPNSWGQQYRKGCKTCDCDRSGSIGQSCDLQTGKCTCREGYSGQHCNYCSSGYYGYPECRRCNCDKKGSIINEHGSIECDERGQCPCKALTTGRKCNMCRQATFGLSRNNTDGCTRCFCFGRSQNCHQSDLSWGQIKLSESRNLTIEYIYNYHRLNTDFYYIMIIQMERYSIQRESAEMEIKNGLNILPGLTGNVSIGAYNAFHYPLYFQLPTQFLGDKITSYGGLLKFTLTTIGCNTILQENMLQKYPLIQIHSHYKMILDYYGPEIYETLPNVSFSIPLHETNWRYHSNGYSITRVIMMTALQNIKHIVLRVSTWADFTQVILSNVVMDTAIYVDGMKNNVAIGVEQCECPQQYNGISCQDPGKGYYRWKNITEIEGSAVEDLIGHSVPCECNGRSSTCDKDTGYCQNCTYNTGGYACERCAEGFYGDPRYGTCEACPCPETKNNFARGCTVINHRVNCICKEGYTGVLCERCKSGYYRAPDSPNGTCTPCSCHIEGIVSDKCDELTGQCNCKPGVSGLRCNKCQERRFVLQDYQCQSCDNCTLTLLDTVDEIDNLLSNGILHIDQTEIPAPWLKLLEVEKRAKNVDYALNDYLYSKDYIENYNDTIIDKLHLKVDNALNHAKSIQLKSEKHVQGSDKVRSEAEHSLMNLQGLIKNITGTIYELNKYGTYDHHITLPLALQEAESLLNDIKMNVNNRDNVQNILKCVENSLNKWEQNSNNIKYQFEAVEQFKNDLNDYKKKINELERYSISLLKSLENMDNDFAQNYEKYNKIKQKYQLAEQYEMDMRKYMNENILAEAISKIELYKDNIRKLVLDNETVKVLVNNLNETMAEFETNMRDVRDYYVPQSKTHALDLMERSDNYRRLLLNTKNGAEIALAASSAHKNISEAIIAARDATEVAIAAAIKSHKDLKLDSKKSIIDEGLISLHKSHQIQSEAMEEIDKLEDLDIHVKENEKIVQNINNTIWKTGLMNNKILSELNSFSKDDAKNLIKNSKESAAQISDNMQNVIVDVTNMKADIYKLKDKLDGLEPNWDTKLGRAEENISETLTNIRQSNKTLSTIETLSLKYNENFRNWNSTISIQLQALRDKITLAKHAADGIRVSLDSKDPKCIRSYIPSVFGFTTSTTIKMSIALNKDIENSPLLFIQGEQNRFIALEMVKKQIRFLWNLGDTTAVITHPIKMQIGDPKKEDDWYHIEANRTLNVGSLSVRRIIKNSSILENASVVTNASKIEYTRLVLNPTSRIWLGGVPLALKQPELLSSDVDGLGLIVHQIYIDGQPLGIWNFVHSEGTCGGEVQGPTESTSNSNARHFNGEGYAVVSKTRPRPYRKNFFALQMTFKTLDENALLFLAVDEINNRSVSLTLFEGKIVFRIDYGGELKLEINTTKRYNTGKWISVEAAREFTSKRGTENGSLKVNNEEPMTGSPTAPISANSLPDLSKGVYYLGGVQPGFKSGSTKAPGADHAFLGCMENVQINGETYDAIESSTYFGVEPGCKDTVTKAGFYKNGFVELPSFTLKKKSNFGFVFRTLQDNCLILLSAFPPNISDFYDAKDMRGNYSVSLIDGKLQVWIDAGQGRINLMSNNTLNDGEYHVIIVTKFGRKIELRIDDELHMIENLPSSPYAVNMPEELGGLYIGGAPEYPEYSPLVPTFDGFEGAIRDIVFNNKLITFNQAMNFTNVHMGRSGPEMGSKDILNLLLNAEPIGRSFKATTEGCHRVGSYSYEPNAFKFGDGQHSYSLVNIAARNIWQKNFHIKFDFRTFYPNGVLFVSPGIKEKQKHFITLTLRDGALLLIVRGRRKEEVTLPNKLNDGHWHHVNIQSINRKATITVHVNGHQSTANLKLPKKMNISNMMFVGGISENSLTLPADLITKLEEFKGCIRRFSINNASQDLARPEQHQNVGQCFQRVEKGTYFPGDAFAIYKRNFHVGKYLELELEFRTSELNGILLSVSEPKGFPALSLEIHNGKIIMSCDLGDGNPLRVETVNPSKYAFCDNRWHIISAIYDSEQIVLRIDNQPSISGLAPNHMASKVHTKAPLYIGGLPDVAPSGTLLSRENFKGCIRNMLIRNELKDWTDMDGLNNVLLSECLTVK